ncbi:MAG TPA: response regulator [Streptosporangiaceae bacterium]|nr:response regulator [Streptosporangiaceae bacterium]
MTGAGADPAEIFVDETTKRLDEMDAVLLAIESGGAGPGRADAEAIGTLFRHAHTIKGGAAMLGMPRIEAVTHAVEDVLALARDGGAMPTGLETVLLRATATVRQQVTGEITDAEAETEVEAVVNELADRQAWIQAAGERRAESPPKAETTESPDAQSPDAQSPDAQSRDGDSSDGDSSDGDSSEGDSSEGAQPTVARPEQRPRQSRPLRVSAEKIDSLLNLVGEVVQDRRALAHALGDLAAPQEIVDVLAGGDRTLEQLKDVSIQMRTLPLSVIAGPLPRAVRDMARQAGKDVELTITGSDTELDRLILESLPEPLTHLLRNAVSHGIETPQARLAAGKPERGRIELRAEPRGSQVEIAVSDDGQGVSEQVLAQARREGSLAEVLGRAGYSTAGEVTELAGRGVGMNAIKTYVESLGGSLEIRSTPGLGTEVVLLLPLAMALLEVLLFERDTAVFGMPLAAVEEVLPGQPHHTLGGTPCMEVRGRVIPVTDFAAAIGATARPLADNAPALLISAGGSRAIVSCDALIGQQEVVVKPLGPLLAGIGGYLGAAILGDGRIALLVEPSFAARRQRQQHGPTAVPQAASELPAGELPAGEPPAASKILVAEDSFTVRELQRTILQAAGYQVVTARDGREALQTLRREVDVALVVTDLEMPELDGLELTKSIRADPARSSLPVVIVTSHASQEDRRLGIDAGADAYMAKNSFDQHELLATVERLVGRCPP